MSQGTPQTCILFLAFPLKIIQKSWFERSPLGPILMKQAPPSRRSRFWFGSSSSVDIFSPMPRGRLLADLIGLAGKST